MPKMQAIVDMPFGVGIREKGETFEATEHEAGILEALKRARRLDEQGEAPAAVSGSEPAPAADKPATENRAAKTYARRDLKAE